MRTIILVSIIALVGCSKPDEAPVEQSQPKPEPEQARVEWSVPIVWEAADGSPLGVPLIQVDVRDHPTRMVVDTSSHYNTLTQTFAAAIRAPVSASKEITRVQGKLDQAVKVEGIVPIDFGADAWRLENVVAAQGLPQTDTWGIGGLLAPLQFVDFMHSLVVDFRGEKVYLVSGGENHLRVWFEERFGEPTLQPVTADVDGLLYVDTEIGGENPKAVRAILDTGSAYSRFGEALLDVMPQSDECVEGLDPFGGCIPGRVIEGQSIEFAGTRFDDRRIAAVPQPPGHPKMRAQGALGMDVLRHCTMAFTASTESVWVVCAKP